MARTINLYIDDCLYRFVKGERLDCVIVVESEETDYFSIRNLPLIRNAVMKAKGVVTTSDESAGPVRAGGFIEWATFTLHALRIELAKSYYVSLDLLSEMPSIGSSHRS